MPRVLIAARDAGAAHQNRAFVDACLKQSRRIEFLVLVQPPAADVFSGCQVPIREVDLSHVAPSVVGSTFSGFQPDFVLAGLSSFGEGIDEAVLAYAKQHGVATGAIQDYWGFPASDRAYYVNRTPT